MMPRHDLRCISWLPFLGTIVGLFLSGPAWCQPDQDAMQREVAGAKRLAVDDEIWINIKEKRVIIGGVVSMQEGPLEMFACPKGTKEYESVVALNTKAFSVHAALLAVGAKPGHPVRFRPEYQAAEGATINVEVVWVDAEGATQRMDARQWVRDAETQEALDQKWVFAGSGFWKDDESGEEYYFAEGGELICVSNFSTATLDLPMVSSQSNDDRLFEAFTANVPPPGTKVRLILSPMLQAADANQAGRTAD